MITKSQTLSESGHPPYDLLSWGKPCEKFPAWFWAGAFIIAASETLLYYRIEPVYTHFTLIVWWGYILFLDGIIKRRRGVSFLADRPRFFVFMAAVSLFWWLIFEFYNCYLENWIYIGLPPNIIHRYICYALAYATITPAILETYEIFLTFWPPRQKLDFTRRPHKTTVWLWFFFGLLSVTVPLLIPWREVRHYLFAFVWMGFVFLLEPLAYWSGGYSLLRLWSAGCRKLAWLMFVSGGVCGLLWEFWNYWAGAKWLYTIPFSYCFDYLNLHLIQLFGYVRYFEMPFIGFLGFLPFAWECLVLIQFTALAAGGFPLTPNDSVPSRKMVWGARGLLALLFGVFVLAYAIQDKRYFPIDSFSLSAPSAGKNDEAALKMWLEYLSDSKPPPSALEQDIQWSPHLAASRELFRRLRFKQNYPNVRLRWWTDRQLREYAVYARFNWALRKEITPPPL
ncbi:MAG: hypothetical protein AB1656_19420 [Candidatus Omnitrophota bacterium]